MPMFTSSKNLSLDLEKQVERREDASAYPDSRSPTLHNEQPLRTCSAPTSYCLG